MTLVSRPGRSPLLLSRIAMFVAIGIVSGLALSGVPNVELVTAVCFVAGFMLGTSAGLLTGALTELLFAGFHPMGSSAGPLLAAQVIGMALAGVAGAAAWKIVGARRSGRGFIITVTALGVAVTFVFDLLTNLAFSVVAGFSVSQMMVPLVAAAPFAAVHLLSNALVFILVVVPLLPRLERALKIS